MKARILLFIAVVALIAACNKKPAEAPPSAGMKSLKVGSTFGWSTAETTEFRIYNIPAGVLRISSADESILYLKAYFPGNTEEYRLNLSLPTYEKSVMINSTPVNVSRPFTEFRFPETKSISVNHSMSFNGTTDWIKMAGSAGISFPNNCTFEAWVKPARQQSVKIVQKGDWDGCGLGQDLYKGFQAHIYLGNNVSAKVDWGSGQPALNTWYHLAGVFDGSTLSLYVNGVLKNSMTISATLANNNRTVSIGSDNGGQKFFQGLIDEVCIWTTALSLQQVNAGMAASRSGSETGIKALWHFNEGSGLTVYDATSGHYDGTITGAIFNTDVGYAQGSDSDGDGVPNSYDDYPNDPGRAFNNYFPATGGGSLSFEDLWPGQGDYDFNDLVVNYHFNTVTNAQNKIVECLGTFILRAAGASFPSGFGFQLSNASIPSSAISCSGYSIFGSYINLSSNGLEAGQNKPTVIVTDNDFMALGSPSGMINTVPGFTYITPDTITISLTFSNGQYSLADLDLANFNPFIILNGDRGREVHLADHAPTALANTALLGTWDDTSIPSQGRYYRTASNLPWAINIYENFDYAKESADILSAYLKMAAWATSNGADYADWYKNLSGYRNPSNIYSH